MIGLTRPEFEYMYEIVRLYRLKTGILSVEGESMWEKLNAEYEYDRGCPKHSFILEKDNV